MHHVSLLVQFAQRQMQWLLECVVQWIQFAEFISNITSRKRQFSFSPISSLYVIHIDTSGVIPHWRVLLWRALVWRVSLWRLSFWRDSSSARFSLARFHFGAFLFGALPLRRVSLWRVSQFCTNLRWSGICERQFRADYLCACFLSAEKSCLPLFARVAYLFCAHVSFRSSVVSILRSCFLSAKKCFLRQLDAFLVLRLCWSNMRVWRVVAPMFPFCEIVFFYARISFLRIFPLCVAANWRRQHFFAENTRRN